MAHEKGRLPDGKRPLSHPVEREDRLVPVG